MACCETVVSSVRCQGKCRRCSLSHRWYLTHWGRNKMATTFKCIFSNENLCISLKLSLKFVSWAPITNIITLVHVMAWCRPGDKPLSEQWWLVYWRIYASLGLNELNGIPQQTITYQGPSRIKDNIIFLLSNARGITTNFRWNIGHSYFKDYNVARLLIKRFLPILCPLW